MPRKLIIPSTGHSKIWTDLLPAKSSQHGRHIYVFRNIATNQIVYTLYPRLIQRTLRQLPFFGKHSVPASVRPDLWTPFCRVGPFPSPEQGTRVVQLLHEFRQLHQLCWKDTNPGLNRDGKKALIKRLMNQKANSVADLAKVLLMQEKQASQMKNEEVLREKEQKRFLNRRWAELEKVAQSVKEGAIDRLKDKIRSHKVALGRSKDDREESARLAANIKKYEQRIRTLEWTQDIVHRQSSLQLANEEKYKKRWQKYEAKRKKLQEEGNEEALQALSASKPKLEINHIRTSMLPAALKPKPSPFTTESLWIQWADLKDAEYAKSWPKYIFHDTMPRVSTMRQQGFVTETEWDLKSVLAQRKQEIERLLQNPSQLDKSAKDSAPVVAGSPKQTGIWQYLPKLNPFNRASA